MRGKTISPFDICTCLTLLVKTFAFTFVSSISLYPFIYHLLRIDQSYLDWQACVAAALGEYMEQCVMSGHFFELVASICLIFVFVLIINKF